VTPRPSQPSTDLSTLALTGLGAVVALGGLLWVGAWLAATTTGHVPPPPSLAKALAVLTVPSDPTTAWGTPMPGPVAYWTATTVVLAAAAGLATAAVVAWRRSERRRLANPRLLHGVATGPEVAAAAGLREVRRRARHARPSLHRPAGTDVGYRLGRSRGVEAWASVEDSMLLVGPPRSGKGLHLVIPMILDAPGAVVTTSTRPDNLTVTLEARHAAGPIAVFDPQQLAPNVTGSLRWSPVRGCELPQTAMIRARALAAGTGMSRTVDGGDFWQGQTETVLRSLLHAAALDGRTARDLYRWSLDPATVADAITILGRPGAAPGWDDALEQAAHADPRTRDSIWLGVRQALSGIPVFPCPRRRHPTPRAGLRPRSLPPRPGHPLRPRHRLRCRGRRVPRRGARGGHGRDRATAGGRLSPGTARPSPPPRPGRDRQPRALALPAGTHVGRRGFRSAATSSDESAEAPPPRRRTRHGPTTACSPNTRHGLAGRSCRARRAQHEDLAPPYSGGCTAGLQNRPTPDPRLPGRPGRARGADERRSGRAVG